MMKSNNASNGSWWDNIRRNWNTMSSDGPRGVLKLRRSSPISSCCLADVDRPVCLNSNKCLCTSEVISGTVGLLRCVEIHCKHGAGTRFDPFGRFLLECRILFVCKLNVVHRKKLIERILLSCDQEASGFQKYFG